MRDNDKWTLRKWFWNTIALLCMFAVAWLWMIFVYAMNEPPPV